MPQFDIEYFSSQLFWLIIFFVILYLFISRFAVKILESIITKRETNIQDNIKEANDLNDQIQNLQSINQSCMNELIQDIKESKYSYLQDLSNNASSKEKEFTKNIEDKRQKLQDKFMQDKKIFIKEEQNYIIDLAASIILKITNKNADLKSLQKIYKENI